MQTEMLERQDVSAKFRVEVPANEVDKAYGAVVRSLARQVKVPGFRPGKAPRGVIEARIGKDAVAQEVRDALVETYYPQAARELDLAPVAANFHAHEPAEGQAYSFEVEVELYPEITLPNVQDIVIDTASEPITDEMVTETVENLQRENATLIPVERPAEPGDYLTVETTSTGSTMPIDLERVDEAFATQFYGKAMGDEVTLRLDAPSLDEDIEEGEADAETSAQEGADGEADAAQTEVETDETTEAQEASTEETDSEGNGDADTSEEALPTLEVVITDIRAKEKPEADDEFAKTLGFDTWADAEARIRQSLQAQLDQEAFSEQQEEFVDKLLEETELTLPQSLINRRKRNLLDNLARDLEARGMTMQSYIESLETDEKRQEFEAELDEAAQMGVKRDLVLEKLLEARGADVSKEELDAALIYMAQRQDSTVVKLRQELGRDGIENYRFLLARDKAVRETVRELLGEQTEDTEEDSAPSAAEDAENAETDDPEVSSVNVADEADSEGTERPAVTGDSSV